MIVYHLLHARMLVRFSTAMLQNGFVLILLLTLGDHSKMDAKVTDNIQALPNDTANEEFLLNEGLELLANYRAIGDDAIRRAVRELIASLSDGVLLPS